ncbi:MAG: copper transporter [Coriobacteriia bacterium]|nr:copper transporter [Coriobacteriia bacterium]
MYNLRYHIVSLVAVFLALAIGLVLGGLVVQQGSFSRQQDALVSGLQRDFRKLKNENSRLKKEVALQNSYSEQITSAWAKNRLKGHAVVILTSGAEKEGAAAAAADVRTAGGTPVTVTILKREFGLNDEKVVSALRSVVATDADLRPSLPASLAAEWTTPDEPRPMTDALVKAGAIKVAGFKGSKVATDLVSVAAFLKEPDAVALDIGRAYADSGYYAIGAQTPTSGTGVAAAAVARRLSAFDTLGTQPGRFTLVALLSGGEQGYFGLSANTIKPFPALPDDQ